MEEHNGSFLCPTHKLVHQLIEEIKLLNRKLEKIHPVLLPRLDNADLMKEFHISRTSAANWRNTGLMYTKVGNKIYYERADIESFLLKRKMKGF